MVVGGEENRWYRQGRERDSGWWVPEDPEGWVSGRGALVLLSSLGRRQWLGPGLCVCGEEMKGRVGRCFLYILFQ